MKRMFVLYASTASLVLMAACDASAVRDDEATGGSEPIVQELTSEQEGGFTTSTPDGVVAPTPEGKFVGQTYLSDDKADADNEEGILACRVSLLFCRDSRFGNLPSGCTNGGCSISQAHNAAVSLCQDVCGNIDCSVIAWPAGCL